MAETLWYYAKNEQQHGPISSAELRQLAASAMLTREDLVWREGMENWAPAGKVKGLFVEVADAVSTIQTTMQAAPADALASPEMAAMLETLDAPPVAVATASELFSTSDPSPTVVRNEAKKAETPTTRTKTPSAPKDLLWISQFAIWCLCAVVLVTAGLVFARQYLKADGSTAESAAASVFIAFALGAYLLALASERIAGLLQIYFQRKRRP